MWAGLPSLRVHHGKVCNQVRWVSCMFFTQRPAAWQECKWDFWQVPMFGRAVDRGGLVLTLARSVRQQFWKGQHKVHQVNHSWSGHVRKPDPSTAPCLACCASDSEAQGAALPMPAGCCKSACEGSAAPTLTGVICWCLPCLANRQLVSCCTKEF